MSEISPRGQSAPAQPEPELLVTRSDAEASVPHVPLTDAYRVATAPKLSSEQVIVAAPMSFVGSAQRIWRITAQSGGLVKGALGALAAIMILTTWVLVLCWYLIFGLLLVPYRVLRRGQRKSRKQALQHREMLAAIEQQGKR